MLSSSTKPTVTSLDEDLKTQQAAKYSVERENEARQWIEEILKVKLEGTFAEALHDGIHLCNLINILNPTVKPLKPTSSKLSFKQMENIHLFLLALADLKVPSFETFQTVDLYEEKNMNQVVDCMFALSRCAEKNGFQGPKLGPKLATAVKREFTEQQLKEAKYAIPKLARDQWT